MFYGTRSKFLGKNGFTNPIKYSGLIEHMGRSNSVFRCIRDKRDIITIGHKPFISRLYVLTHTSFFLVFTASVVRAGSFVEIVPDVQLFRDFRINRLTKDVPTDRIIAITSIL